MTALYVLLALALLCLIGFVVVVAGYDDNRRDARRESETSRIIRQRYERESRWVSR